MFEDRLRDEGSGMAGILRLAFGGLRMTDRKLGTMVAVPNYGRERSERDDRECGNYNEYCE